MPSAEKSINRLLDRFGLDRPELRAWAFYDWANSAFFLTVVATVFPIFFLDVAADGLPRAVGAERYSWATSLALLVIALAAPVLGAMADYGGFKKRFLGSFLALGATATACMFFIHQGQWLFALVLFGLANIGVQGSVVFYDSLLPHVARQDEIDRVSAAGFALGYLGSSMLLALQLAWILKPAWFGLPAGAGITPDQASLPARLAFVSVAVWWIGFAIPLFRRVSEPVPQLEPDERPGQNPLAVAIQRLRETFQELRTYRHAFLMLVAFLVYNDGIGTIVRMATLFGAEIGIGRGVLIGAILLVQVIGVPFALLFGRLAGRIGAKRAILVGLTIYVGVASYAYFIDSAIEFFGLAIFVGMVQGGCQALSRSLFASMIPRHKSSEFFGFYGVLEKFAGVLGPAIFAMTIRLTGSSRHAILSVIVFFVVGALLLSRVNVDAGRAAARRADEGRPAAP